MSFHTHLRAACALFALAAPGFLMADADPLRPAWEDASRSLFREAYARFETAEGREARLGEAATLLQLQPKTDGNIRAAVKLLTAIVEDSTNDETGLVALYLLGRIEHTHRTGPDLEAAALHYRRLLALRPDHPLAGQAAAKLALIELYQPRPTDERLALVAKWDALARGLAHAPARRDVHLILGEAVLRFELDPGLALDHFVAALEAGIVLPLMRANTLVRVGELARETGRVELARGSYQEFLKNYPRDPRRQLVQEKLASLPDPSA